MEDDEEVRDAEVHLLLPGGCHLHTRSQHSAIGLWGAAGQVRRGASGGRRRGASGGRRRGGAQAAAAALLLLSATAAVEPPERGPNQARVEVGSRIRMVWIVDGAPETLEGQVAWVGFDDGDWCVEAQWDDGETARVPINESLHGGGDDVEGAWTVVGGLQPLTGRAS